MAVASNSSNKEISPSASTFPGYGDPCLDLFLNVRLQRQNYRDDGTYTLEKEQDDSPKINYLKKLLPVAWSHNPLTTLKLICNLCTVSIWYPPRAFDTAAIWLHQNHPRTLLCSLPTIADCSVVGILLEILYHLVQQGYKDDPAYKLLHDRAMDLFAEHLKSDIEKMKQGKLELKPSDFSSSTEDEDEDDDEDNKFDGTLDPDAFADLITSGAAMYCQSKHPIDMETNRAVSLFESMAKRLLPPESQSDSEWERFQKEVLAPLDKYWNRQGMFTGRERCPLRKHLEEVKAAPGNAVDKPEALLPHEIITLALEDGDGASGLGEAAELQWKAMVDMYRKQGKFRNCLALCNAYRVSGLEVGLGLLLSELTEEKAWKGKVMRFGGHELLLHPIQGQDLKSKCEFMRTSYTNPLAKRAILDVFDTILQVAVKENLKPEQMINKVFVLTGPPNDESLWYMLYEASRGKFKEQGYDEAMPHLFVWSTSSVNAPSMPLTQHPGVTVLSGKSGNLIKFFFDNGGDIGLRNLMEIDIDCKKFQTLSVVD